MKRNRRPELRSARLGLSMLEIREATIQDGILEYLRWRQIPADPTHSTRNHPEIKGMLDIMAALPPTGRMCLLEVKSEDGIMSAEQEAIMKKYHAAGVLVAVVRSVEDVQRAIDCAIDESRSSGSRATKESRETLRHASRPGVATVRGARRFHVPMVAMAAHGIREAYPPNVDRVAGSRPAGDKYGGIA